MTPYTVLTLADLSDSPRVKIGLPVPLRTGDRIRLAFKLKRKNNGRSEVLDVSGEFRVTQAVLSLEAQTLSVESVGKAPTWRAVRKDVSSRRELPPAIFPRTVP